MDDPEIFKNVHFETYKQLRETMQVGDQEVSKVEIYEKLLQPFKYEKYEQPLSEFGRSRTIYV